MAGRGIWRTGGRMTPVDAALMHAVMIAVEHGPCDLDVLVAQGRARVPWVGVDRVARAVAALEVAGWVLCAGDVVTATDAGRLALARSAAEAAV